MILTPAQRLLARRAARMILRSQVAVLQDGSRPTSIVLAYEDAQCLLAAAAHCPDLELGRMDLDLGTFAAPAGENEAPAEWHHPS